MDNIKYKLLVQSGKGGVGKTTVAVNLAYSLAKKNYKVGLLDVDIHGPNAPKMLGLEDKKVLAEDNKIIPIKLNENLEVMSMAFLLDKKDAVIWRGPLKHNLLKQFVQDVKWSNLDYLIIDFPPGTGDEHISISQLIKNITGSIIVSTPQQVALLDVIKAIDFCKKVNISIIGMIENMSGDIFGAGNVKTFADARDIDFLGTLSLDKKISESSDKGEPFVETGSESAKAFNKITDKIIKFCKK